MQKEAITTAKTVEEAIEAACRELGCSRDDVQVEILEAPVKKRLLGFLGGETKCKVKVTLEVPEEATVAAAAPASAAESRPAPRRAQAAPAPAAAPSEPAAAPAAPAEDDTPGVPLPGTAAEDYLRRVLEGMDVGAFSLSAQKKGDILLIRIEGDDLGAIIGRRGETLDALQHLTGLVNRREENGCRRVQLDCGDYRARREAYLAKNAKNAISRALRQNRSIALEPMSAYERRFIHTIVQQAEGVSSWSVGEEPNRRVIIASDTAPRTAEPRAPREGEERRRSRGGRGRGRGGERRGASHSDRPVYEHEKGTPIGSRTGHVPRAKVDVSLSKPKDSSIGGRVNDGELFALYEKIVPTRSDDGDGGEA